MNSPFPLIYAERTGCFFKKAEARKNAAAKKADKQRILAIIGRKQNEKLENLTIDELNALL